MALEKATFIHKAPGDELFSTEVETLRDAINANADVLAQALADLLNKVDAAGVATVLSAAGKPLNALVLPMVVRVGLWYTDGLGIWEARQTFSASVAPTAGANWRQIASFTGTLSPAAAAVTAASITDATAAGRALMTAADAATQLALVDKLSITANEFGTHPAFSSAYGKLAGADNIFEFILKTVLAVAQVQAPKAPDAPTLGQVDDVYHTFSFLPNPAFPAFTQYKVAGLPGVTGAVALDTTNSYVSGGRVYVRVSGSVAVSGLAVYVAGSGNRPDGSPLLNASAFTGTAIAPNQPPVASAGSDLAITQPTSTVQLMGSGSDPDVGDTVTHLWSQVTGPATTSFGTPGLYNTTVSGLTAVGTYQFRLTVTDNHGASTASNVVVTVNPAAVLTLGAPSPTSGPVGSQVNLQGTNLSGATGYTFNGVAGTTANISGNTATSITLVVPAGASSGPVTVTTTAGTATSAGAFTVTVAASNAPPTPALTYPRLKAGSTVTGDSMSTGLGGVTDWPDQYGATQSIGIKTFASSTDYTTPTTGNVFDTTRVNNLASSGAGSRRIASTFFSVAPFPAVAPLGTMFGLNNLRLAAGVDPTKRYAMINAAHRAMLAVQFAKTMVLPFGGNGTSGYKTNFTASNSASAGAGFPSVALLQDWGSRTVYHRSTAADSGANAFYQPSITTGETVTFAISGDAIAIGTWGCDGATTALSRFQVTIDGVLKTTYDPTNRTEISTIPSNRDGYTQDGLVNDAMTFYGLGTGAHTVVLTFLDAGKTGVWDYACTLKTATEAYYTGAFVLDVPLLSTTQGIGYTYPGFPTTRANLITASSNRTSALQAAFPNYPIAFVDTNAIYNPETIPADVQQVDGIHETTQGHGKIAQRAGQFMNNDVAGSTATPTPAPTPVYPNYQANAQVITFPINTHQTNPAGVVSTTATATGYGNTGLSSYGMPANAASSITLVMAPGDYDAILGVSTSIAQTPYASMLAGFYRSSGTTRLGFVASGAVTSLAGSVPDNARVRLARGADGTLTLQLSTDGGSTYGAVLGTQASNPAVILYVVSDLEQHGQMAYPQGAGLIVTQASTAIVPGATALPVIGTNIVTTSGRSYTTAPDQSLGSYGNTGRSGYKLIGAGYFAHVAGGSDALDVVVGFGPADATTSLVNMLIGTWNSSGSTIYLGRRISAQDLAGSPVRQGLSTPSTIGDVVRLLRVVNANGDSVDHFFLEQSSDGGSSWNRLYAYAQTMATNTPVYVVYDFSGPGVLYYPQGVGLVAA